MELLIDIGNSSLKWATQENNQFVTSGAFNYTKNGFVKELQESLSFLEKPAAVLVSNVIENEIFELLNGWTIEKWQLECWQPKVSKQFKELKNSYSDTRQMGLDRWLAMVAARDKYHSAICLVGCGTAVTIDLIDEAGQHLGGYIIPGIELMQKALVGNTVQINVDIKKEPSTEYAKDTQTSVNNGAFMAVISTINNVVETFSDKFNNDITCIISGGMAESIKPLLNYSFEHEPNLVLMGLSILHKAKQ